MFIRLAVFIFFIVVLVSNFTGYSFASFYSKMDIDLKQGSKLYKPVFLDGIFGGKKEKKVNINRDIADFKIVDRDSFYKYAKEVYKVPFNEQMLSFKMFIPDTWEEIALRSSNRIDISSDIPVTLSYYMGPPISELRPRLKVQAMRLTREITAKNWLRHFILTNGYSMLDDKIIYDGDKFAATNFVYVESDITYLGYLRAIIHGDIVSIVRIDVPQKFERLYKVLQQEAINSFILTHPQGGGVEVKKRQKLGDGALYVSYPASWVRKKQVHNEAGEKIAFELHNIADEKTVFGFMKFETVKRNGDITLKSELDRIKQELKNRFGIKIKKIISSKPSYGPIRFDYIREEIYKVGFNRKIDAQDHELRFLVMADVEWYIFIYMLSPLEENDQLNWAINDRAYKIIRDSFE